MDFYFYNEYVRIHNEFILNQIKYDIDLLSFTYFIYFWFWFLFTLLFIEAILLFIFALRGFKDYEIIF